MVVTDPGSSGPDGALVGRPAIDGANDTLDWYALYVRSRHERTVQDNLKARGYQAFSPFYKVRRRRAQRTVDLDVPLFPSYVFCEFNVHKRLPILQLPGVVFAVSRAGVPEAINPKEIAAMRAVLATGRPIQPWAFLQSGQKVRVRAGALDGTEGILLKVKSQDRLIVSISVLQRSVAVQLDQDMVEPIY